ncbi:hypothetical protein PENFLA_c029G07590 [Penicillium flavigenum]|uniref:Uncharacterized protein n=1 Tax=Penicillium flavigenum TaxID=254877 RepID=A0A1V6SPS9_9EURO|nr:hypothetical protein PENFLA_c029G07590 [Penicillium flavigenum]
MESLPPELISRVVEYIAQVILWEDDAPVSLGPYITVDHFARNLHLFPASVRNLDIEFHNLPPSGQDYPPDVTVNGADLLSSHLRNFSQQLESLDTNQSVIGPELFRRLYTAVTPSGECIFNWEPDEAEDDDTDDAYQSSEDAEDDYPEHLRIFLEDTKR